MQNNKSAVQILEEQQGRFQALQASRTRLELRIEAERKALKEAQDQAIAEFGTADIAELRALFEARQAENTQKVSQFVSQLDQVASQIQDIERQLQG